MSHWPPLFNNPAVWLCDLRFFFFSLGFSFKGPSFPSRTGFPSLLSFSWLPDWRFFFRPPGSSRVVPSTPDVVDWGDLAGAGGSAAAAFSSDSGSFGLDFLFTDRIYLTESRVTCERSS
jgi:hypothetical protein